MNYVCGCCGYVYEVDRGEMDNSVEPGTPFEDIEDCSWYCPLCGSPKDDFNPLEATND